MSKPILVGYDPAGADRAPVAFGVAAARFTGAPLVVAAVHAGLGVRERAGGEIDRDLPEDATAALGEVHRELDEEGIGFDCVALEATSASRALHEAAEQRDAGLLVVGSTRRGTVGRVLPGSTAERLMQGAPCPIAVVPAGWETRDGLRTVGVAYVDSDEGREALRGAHALARRAGATLRVLTAVRPDTGTYRESEPHTASQRGKSYDEVEGEQRVRAEQGLESEVAGLGDDVPIETDAYVEDPADVLVRVSENLDVLVCGSRGYGPLRAVLLGGVSRRVAAEAHCPVIVLPRGIESSLQALMDDAAASSPAG